MKGNKSHIYTGRGDKNIGPVNLSTGGMWHLQVETDNGNVVANISLTNGETHESRLSRSTSEHDYYFSRFYVGHDYPRTDLKVSASPTTDWTVTLSLISEASPVNANNQIEEKEAMQTQTPEYVCVNIDINDPVNNRLNVRSGPSTKFDQVLGGDREKGGGAVQGVRYKVVRTEPNGELISGNPIWHEIEFKEGVSGWVSEYYVDPC